MFGLACLLSSFIVAASRLSTSILSLFGAIA
jgi:hypothetical protein